jgi:hypothetical protein
MNLEKKAKYKDGEKGIIKNLQQIRRFEKLKDENKQLLKDTIIKYGLNVYIKNCGNEQYVYLVKDNKFIDIYSKNSNGYTSFNIFRDIKDKWEFSNLCLSGNGQHFNDDEVEFAVNYVEKVFSLLCIDKKHKDLGFDDKWNI